MSAGSSARSMEYDTQPHEDKLRLSNQTRGFVNDFEPGSKYRMVRESSRSRSLFFHTTAAHPASGLCTPCKGKTPPGNSQRDRGIDR
jgi:hypothetical protein